MKRNLWSFVSLAILAFAGWQAVVTLSRTPALNQAFRMENAAGNTLPGYGPAMYDRADYYLWTAFGWFGRTATTAVPGENGRAEETGAALVYQGRLRDAATESLRYSPSQPDAWMLVARAQAALGRPEFALAAYRQWRNLAPHSQTRAAARLNFLTGLMEDPEIRDLALLKIDPNTVREDLQTAREWKPAFVEHISQSPAIAAFDIEQLDED